MSDRAGRRPRLPEPPELEAELRALGRAIDVPAAPDLTAEVRRRLGQTEGPLGRPDAGRRRGTRRARWRAAVVGALALLVVLAVTPPGRAVVTHVFRFAGIELRQEPGPARTPTSAPTSPTSPASPQPGERLMSFDRARRLVAFPILVPAAFGPPRTVAVRDGGRVASLVYPRTPYGEVRLDEFDGHLDSIVFTKFVQADNAAEVRVAGRKALWVSGPHDVLYVRRDGTADSAAPRLTTGNTLIWDTGRVALRLEGAIDRDRAIAIAAATRRP
jgi:hypothetical protein